MFLSGWQGFAAGGLSRSGEPVGRARLTVLTTPPQGILPSVAGDSTKPWCEGTANPKEEPVAGRVLDDVYPQPEAGRPFHPSLV